MLALSTNRLASSPEYQKILHLYNAEFERSGGRVNDSKFYREVILPLLPKYHLQSWYQFLRRFKTTTGLLSAQVVDGGSRTVCRVEEKRLEQNMLTNEIATSRAIQYALNIGAEAAERILKNPELMTDKEAIDLFFKAMRAQDSRIHAIGKIKEDTREQEKLERLFNEATYG
jgi:hypothetical protein